jgi:hypothetical protein
MVPGPDPAYVDGGLTACAAAITTAPPVDPALWFAYAAFPGCSSPRLKVVTFGCDFDNTQVAIMWTATRPQATQIFYPDQASWPYTGSGVAVGFFDTLTDQVNEIYVFAGYGYQDAQFCLVPHPDPVIGGSFADDNDPSNLDPIAGYGCLGFGVPGAAACPADHFPGACCVDATCEFICESQCTGAFLGEGVLCDPNPCVTPGACCIDEVCYMLIETDCLAQGGSFVGGDCTEDLCVPIIPTETTTWGQIKNIYR